MLIQSTLCLIIVKHMPRPSQVQAIAGHLPVEVRIQVCISEGRDLQF